MQPILARDSTRGRTATPRLATLLLALTSSLASGCASHRMAITGAACGVVTGPVSCCVRGFEVGWILMLPFSIPIGVASGWELGRRKDQDYALYGFYTAPGTLRMASVFDPFRYFPYGPLEGQCLYDGRLPLTPAFRWAEQDCRAVLVRELCAELNAASIVALNSELTRLLRLDDGALIAEVAEGREASNHLARAICAHCRDLHLPTAETLNAQVTRVLRQADPAFPAVVTPRPGAFRRASNDIGEGFTSLDDIRHRLSRDPTASLNEGEQFDVQFLLAGASARRRWAKCIEQEPDGVHCSVGDSDRHWIALHVRWEKPTFDAPDELPIRSIQLVDGLRGGDLLKETMAILPTDQVDYFEVVGRDSRVPLLIIDTDRGPIVRVLMPELMHGPWSRKLE